MISFSDFGVGVQFQEFGDQRLREPKKAVHYSYPLTAVFDAVYRKTSLIGKHRKTKDGVSRLDDIALTQDEYEIFLDMANDAGLEVFNKIMAYIKNEEPSYKFNDGVDNTHIRYKDNGKVITVNSFTSKDYALKTNITFLSAKVDFEMGCYAAVANLMGITEEAALILVQAAPFTLLSDIDTEEALTVLEGLSGIANAELDPFVKVMFNSQKEGYLSDCVDAVAALFGITTEEAEEKIYSAPFVLYERISQRTFETTTAWEGIANVELVPLYDGFEYEYDITLDKPLDENDQLHIGINAKYGVYDYMGELTQREFINLHLLTGIETNFKERHIFIAPLDIEPSPLPEVLPEVYDSLISFNRTELKIDFIVPALISPYDWIEYNDGVMTLYSAIADTDMNSLITDEALYHKMEDDFRFRIHYLIFQPAWVANNATIKTDNSIFEAIVAYIIFKWFLIVLPEEAQLYLQETDDRLRDVKYYLSLPTGRMPIISNPF